MGPIPIPKPEGPFNRPVVECHHEGSADAIACPICMTAGCLVYVVSNVVWKASHPARNSPARAPPCCQSRTVGDYG
jgi:hypothetical protein